MTDTGGILLKILVLGCLCNLYTCDKCSTAPCQHNGRCLPRGFDDYECECPYNWAGRNCEKNVDDCAEKPCKNGGKCIDKQNSKYECKCTDEYIGLDCEFKNPCYPNHNCKNNATCVPLNNGDHYCKCTKFYSGKICNERRSICPVHITQSRGMCNGNGKCENKEDGDLFCRCDVGYHGDFCQLKLITNNIDIGCDGNVCKNGGQCVMADNGIPFCKCRHGFGGNRCEEVVRNPMLTQNRITDDETRLNNSSKTSFPVSTKQVPVCSIECQQSKANGICDQQCNTEKCLFDGGDCDPWKKCNNKRCHNMFRNGKCNPECNSVDCLFDGQDCDKAPCINRTICTSVYQNGICNEECNNPQCGFDGGDCHNKKSNSFFSNFNNIQKCFLDTKLFELDLVLLTSLENFQKNKSIFLQRLGSALKMVLTISNIKEIKFNNTQALSIKLNINPSECVIYGGQCFSSLEQISNFIKAGLTGQGAMSLPFKVANVDSRTIHSMIPKPIRLNSYFVILIAMTTALIISLIIIGVLLRDKWGRLRTKVKTAGVWTPSEGYSTSSSSLISNNKSAWPTLLQPNNVKLEQRNYDNGSFRFDPKKNSRLDAEFDGIPEAINRKRRFEIVDQHDKSVAFQSISDNLQKRDGISPMGPTQAKLVSFINENLQMKSESRYGDCEDVANDIGAYVNDSGESLMHIAARMNCGPNLIKKLHHFSPVMLHTTDEWGRTPLATAAASDAYESVEQLLSLEKQSRKESKQNKIRSGHNSYTSCRTIESPVKTTTGLIESVKLNSKEIINLLLDEGSPVNVLDFSGRSVVHWAAIFNNVALLERLSHMKIFQKLVDLKDNEEKSPLYLAASEGAFDSAKFIVEYIAKVGIKIDQIYPCPRAIAEERGFADIEILIKQAQLPSIYSEKTFKRMKLKDPKILKKLSSPTLELGIINEYKEYSADSNKLDKNSPSGLDSIDSCLLEMYSLEDSSLNNILDSCSNERNNYSSFKPLENNNCHSYPSNTSSSDMSPPLLNLNNPSLLNGYNCHADQLDPALQNAFFLSRHPTVTHNHVHTTNNSSNSSTISNNKLGDITAERYHSDMLPTVEPYKYQPFNINNLSSINCSL